jgi:tetratricopeptide (TPR) repeat protein
MVLITLGDLLLEEGRIEDAIAVLELNVEENPRSVITYDRLADTYLRRSGQGDRDRALTNYRKVLETIPDDTTRDTDFLDQLRRETEASICQLESEEPDIK